MIPNAPNRYGELGVWVPWGEWEQTVAALRLLVLGVEHWGPNASGVEISTASVQAVRDSAERARKALWVLTGEEVGRRTSAPSGDRS